MGDQVNMTPIRPGKVSSKKGNPYRGDPRALFLGRDTPDEALYKRLAEQWDRDHPNGVED
jgi:hypothetical protein